MSGTVFIPWDDEGPGSSTGQNALAGRKQVGSSVSSRLGFLQSTSVILILLASVNGWAHAENQIGTADSQEEPPAQERGANHEYRIGIGDHLGISVWQQKELSQELVPVRPDGMISVPLVRDVRAEGLTCGQLADQLTELLKVYVTNPTVTVVVKEINSLVVYVLGQVKTSGALTLKNRVRLLQAISMSGGFTPYAHPADMVVLRKNGVKEQRIPVNYDRILSGKAPEQNILLQGGDTVVVP
jgi:polysaccharide biosynthesis/export protein